MTLAVRGHRVAPVRLRSGTFGSCDHRARWVTVNHDDRFDEVNDDELHGDELHRELRSLRRRVTELRQQRQNAKTWPSSCLVSVYGLDRTTSSSGLARSSSWACPWE